MSTISYPSSHHVARPPNNPTHQLNTAPASTTPSRISGVQSQDPPIKALELKLDELGAQVDRSAIEHLMRTPHTKASKVLLNNIRSLLTPENLKVISSTDNPTSCTANLGKLENHLCKSSTEALLRPLRADLVNAYIRHVESEMFNLKCQLSSTGEDGQFELVRTFLNQKDHHLHDARETLRFQRDTGTSLDHIATLLKKTIEEIKYAHIDRYEERHFETYDT